MYMSYIIWVYCTTRLDHTIILDTVACDSYVENVMFPLSLNLLNNGMDYSLNLLYID